MPHHPPTAKMYPPPPTKIQNISSKKLFYKKNIKIFYSEVNDEKDFY